MKTETELNDMLSALLSTRKKIVAREGIFTDMPDKIYETLIFVSNSEINMLTWALDLGEGQNDFMVLGVCERCANLGWFWEEANDEYMQVSCDCKGSTPRAGAN